MNVDVLKNDPSWRWYPLVGGVLLLLTLIVWISSKFTNVSDSPIPPLLNPSFNTTVGGSDRTQDKSHGKTINAATAACQERVYHAGDRLVITQHIVVQLDTYSTHKSGAQDPFIKKKKDLESVLRPSRQRVGNHVASERLGQNRFKRLFGVGQIAISSLLLGVNGEVERGVLGLAGFGAGFHPDWIGLDMAFAVYGEHVSMAEISVYWTRGNGFSWLLVVQHCRVQTYLGIMNVE